MESNIVYSRVNNVTDSNPVKRTANWDDFVEMFEEPDQRGDMTLRKYLECKSDPERKDLADAQKDGLGIIPGAFSKKGTKSKADLISRSLLVLDLDDGFYTFDQLARKLKGIECIMHTSYSHSEDCGKFRALIPFDKPVNKSIESMCSRMLDYFESILGEHIDKKCWTVSQLYFTPSCPHDAVELYRFKHIEGEPIYTGDFRLLKIDTHEVEAVSKLTGNRPGDDYNRRGEWDSLLVKLGWKHFFTDKKERSYYTRPGKSIGISGVVFPDSNCFYVYSTDPKVAPFEGGKAFSLFWAYATVEHDGDFSAAARKLLTDGYGDKKDFCNGVDGTMSSIPDYVEELNRTHFVTRNGSKTVVCREKYDITLKRSTIIMSSFTDFKNFQSNKKVSIGLNRDSNPLTIPLGKAWLEHPDRRGYEEILLLPEGDIKGIYNLWRGFTVEPAEGSWELMRKHIKFVICGGDKKLYRYVLNWLARMIQQPWKPGKVALVLQGKKGVGKGKLVNSLCRLFGQNSMSIYNAKHLTGNFNAHLEDCILLYVDEAFWAGDKSGESVLKGLITEPTIPIERKGFDLKPVRNLLHIIMSSNNEWVVPASMDERRYCVIKVSDSHQEDFPYFAAIDEELNNGGLAAMLYDLQKRDISDFNVRAVPNTEGLADQKLQSLDTVMAWWYQKLLNGELLPGIAWDSAPIAYLYDDYVERVQKQGSNIRRVSETAFGKQLHKALPAGWPKKYRPSNKDIGVRVNYYEFPSLDECRKHFDTVLGADNSLDWE